jgi:SAM-dependent methyltransferase
MPSSAESYLLDYHQRLAGVTPRCFGHTPVLRDGETFASTYALLEAAVPREGGALTVLDVACGDGYLLELLAKRAQPGLSLMGLDMSAHELDAARVRLGSAATLHQGRAQALPLADGSVDVVLSHLALMLMDDVERVFAELRRVLKPGGTVSFVVNGDLVRGGVMEVFVGLLRPLLASEAVPPAPLGDARVRNAEGLQALLGGAGFEDVRLQPLAVHGDCEPRAAWDSLRMTYDVDRLSPAALASLEASFLRAVEPLRLADGNIPLRWGMRQVTATAP